MSAEPRALDLADRERVRTLTFHRPERANAFNEVLYHALAGALADAAADGEVSVVVLTGAGRTFSAGTDLQEMAGYAGAHAAGESSGDMGAGFRALLGALADFPKPLLAAVNGSGVGLGLTMLGYCDLVLVAEHARLLAPFTAMGVVPEAGSSYLLPLRMGQQQAALALYTGRWITAEQAVRSGLALCACPAETLLETTHELAREIAAKPLPALLATKRLVTEAHRDQIARARAREDAAFGDLLRAPGLADGLRDRV
ncbi:enoyl-CoA hydratase/isomerase family protein [Actinomadura craniellae]|uniref:Enoyl-CoA hydratase/isomerase family protein n=1 Tax=Actinomadura craniellae TaxID=2231787 RepID=A0A365HBI4_9ACTN|nr:enoyl-CoA hydratase/isomerase family protein [Actinomadura craniellae]RAY16286.1 enoyl-CoA hydratase/isomerase family protein [Actinomadura craniellae]